MDSLPEITSLSRNLLEATLRQAEKDLGMEPMQLPPGDITDQMRVQVWEHICTAVSQLVNQKPGQLKQAFYRVDLNERLFREALASSDPVELLTGLVLKRSLQKVVMRKHYSG